jgi:hypothetical protein
MEYHPHSYSDVSFKDFLVIGVLRGHGGALLALVHQLIAKIDLHESVDFVVLLQGHALVNRNFVC